MKLAMLPVLALAANVAISKEAKRSDDDGLTLRTLTGTFTGLIEPEYPNTRQFLSIPFAKPPVDTLRWLPPEKLPPSDEHRDATQYPASCAQFVTAVPSFYNGNLTRGNTIYNAPDNDTSGLVGADTSEDCLYLAVWTPKAATAPRPDAGLPVLFFMTGGGFTMGGVNVPWQIPTSWVERSQSHIVVTINYRLSIFGFPAARGLAGDDQNLGILDQRAALEWVRDNIAAFGGDPSRITMMGRSAGGVSVDIHAYAFVDEPIAQAHYMQSGNIFGASPHQDPTYSDFALVANQFGCENEEDGAAELECMRQVSFKDIINWMGQHNDRGDTPTFNFNITPDNRTVFTDYEERAEAGKIARVPVIISNTANEISAGVSVDDVTVGPDQALVTSLDISIMVCPTFNATVYRNRLGADVPVFRIQHAGTFPNLNVYSWLGAYHASDITITFGTYELMNYVANTTQFEIDVSQSLQDHILAFVTDPYNGPQTTLGWNPMNTSEPNGGDLIRFGADGIVAQHVDGIEVDGICLGLREYDPFP